jgi:hypothetical protein
MLVAITFLVTFGAVGAGYAWGYADGLRTRRDITPLMALSNWLLVRWHRLGRFAWHDCEARDDFGEPYCYDQVFRSSRPPWLAAVFDRGDLSLIRFHTWARLGSARRRNAAAFDDDIPF